LVKSNIVSCNYYTLFLYKYVGSIGCVEAAIVSRNHSQRIAYLPKTMIHYCMKAIGKRVSPQPGMLP